MDRYIDKYTDNIYETDYIPREAVRCEMYHNQEPLTEHQLNSIPAADVREVVRAIWRYKTMSVPGGKGQTYAKWCCTVCKHKVKERTNYCPNCGADMRQDISNFTLEEQKTYWEAIEKKSTNTDINIHDLI